MFTDQRRSILSMLVGLAVIGLFSGFASGADTTSDGLRAYDVTLTPTSSPPTTAARTTTRQSGSTDRRRRAVHLSRQLRAPGPLPVARSAVHRSAGRAGRDDWWFVIQRYWPASYSPSNHGNWGREVNSHNVAGDAGPDGGIGWSFGSGVSSLALDWLPGQSAPQFTVEWNHPNENLPLPSVSRDSWHTYVVHFVAGRTDHSTPHAGALTVWADGADTPAINLSNINTVQRAQGPDGNWYVQRWMQLWEGDYTQALGSASTVRLTLTRIGRRSGTRSTTARHSAARSDGQFYSGNGANSVRRPCGSRDAQLERRRDPGEPRRRRSVRRPLLRQNRRDDRSRTASRDDPGGCEGAEGKSDADARHRRSGGTASASPAGEAQVASRPPWCRAERLPPSAPNDRWRLSLTSLRWDGKQFFLRGSFARWLRDRGHDYRTGRTARGRGAAHRTDPPLSRPPPRGGSPPGSRDAQLRRRGPGGGGPAGPSPPAPRAGSRATATASAGPLRHTRPRRPRTPRALGDHAEQLGRIGVPAIPLPRRVELPYRRDGIADARASPDRRDDSRSTVRRTPPIAQRSTTVPATSSGPPAATAGRRARPQPPGTPRRRARERPGPVDSSLHDEREERPDRSGRERTGRSPRDPAASKPIAPTNSASPTAPTRRATPGRCCAAEGCRAGRGDGLSPRRSETSPDPAGHDVLASHRPGDTPGVTAAVERQAEQAGLPRGRVQRRVGVDVAERRDQVMCGRARAASTTPPTITDQRCGGDKRKERHPHAPRVQCRHRQGCQRDDHDSDQPAYAGAHARCPAGRRAPGRRL